LRKEDVRIDRIDAKLLRAIQKNNRLTSEKLSDLVGLSPTACQRRLARLRDAKIIEADIAVISPKAVGRSLSMLVLVTLERERSDIIDRFKRTIRSTPEVMNGFYVTGEVDFALMVTARDMEDYEAFTRRFFYENPDIKGFKTFVVMDRVKATYELPIEIEDE
jgi:Lrp/AsnC family transcriptional regulator, leucine-responsive regulatory protein